MGLKVLSRPVSKYLKDTEDTAFHVSVSWIHFKSIFPNPVNWNSIGNSIGRVLGEWVPLACLGRMAAAVQPTSLGTLRKHLTKPSEQVSPPTWYLYHVLVLTSSQVLVTKLKQAHTNDTTCRLLPNEPYFITSHWQKSQVRRFCCCTPDSQADEDKIRWTQQTNLRLLPVTVHNLSVLNTSSSIEFALPGPAAWAASPCSLRSTCHSDPPAPRSPRSWWSSEG